MMDYDHQKTREVDWLVSAFFLLRRAALDDVGEVGKDLLQPFYLEDVDWCFRAHIKGWRVYYVPEVTAKHLYKRGSVKMLNKLSFVHLVNIIIFFAKHSLSMLAGKHRRGSR
jgi:GT2 family glycosyltransferase